MPDAMSINTDAIRAEARKLERDGGEWKLRHVMAVLGCAKSTVYNTPWLLRIAKPVGKRGLRWDPAEVRNRGPLSTDANRARRRTGS